MRLVLTILSLVFLMTFQTNGQQNREPVQDVAQRIMKLYPNPAVSFIKFDFQKNYEKGYTLQVMNFIGRQVQEVKNINASTTLDLSIFNRGVYIYQLKDQSGRVVESGKFQVTK